MADRPGGSSLLCAVVAGALAWAPCAATAEGCARPETVHFPPGASAADVAGGVPRGERDCYVLEARKGQTLAVSQPDAADDNIVFQIYQPPWTIGSTDDGWSFGGRPLPGTEETRDTRAWTGTLPVSGRYLLVVGTSRGSGTYRLRVAIH